MSRRSTLPSRPSPPSRHRPWLLTAALLLGGLAGGCIQDPPLTWGPCPTGFRSQCATVSLPLDWNDRHGEKIDVLVARQPAQSGQPVAQLWLLQGGPGDSADFYAPVMAALGPLLPNVDLYTMEHRGVGDSTRLGCPVEEAPESPGGVEVTTEEWPRCLSAVKAQWGERLAKFNTRNAALDLNNVIQRTRDGYLYSFIYGVSYATYWTQRLLQIDPQVVDGVVLDSIVTPGSVYLSDYHQYAEPALAKLAELCAADTATCAAKLGPQPLQVIRSLYTKIEQGHCAALGLSPQAMREFLARLLASPSARKHIMPLVYRLNRCAPSDLAALTSYVKNVGSLLSAGIDPQLPLRRSPVLAANIGLSELWETPAPTPQQAAAECSSQLACSTALFGELGARAYWPVYRDPLASTWPLFKVPVLALHGQLDAQIPESLGARIVPQLSGASQQYVSMPYSPHGALFFSPVQTPGALPCGMELLTRFVTYPGVPVDPTCVRSLAPLTFSEDPAVVSALLGTSDLWEN